MQEQAHLETGTIRSMGIRKIRLAERRETRAEMLFLGCPSEAVREQDLAALLAQRHRDWGLERERLDHLLFILGHFLGREGENEDEGMMEDVQLNTNWKLR